MRTHLGISHKFLFFLENNLIPFTIQNSYKLKFDMAEKLTIFWQIENFRYVIIMGVKREEILGSFLLPTGKNRQFMHINYQS